MSNSLSFRLLSLTIPRSPNWAVLEAPKVPSFSSKPTRFSPFRTITIERIPTKPIFSASSASQSATLQPIEELPPKLQEIVRLFQGVEEPKAKYEQLLFYGRNLTPLDSRYKTRENKVQGCVSQVWVRAYLDQDKNVIFEADSDSVLTKGLAALLVQGLSGRPVEGPFLDLRGRGCGGERIYMLRLELPVPEKAAGWRGCGGEGRSLIDACNGGDFAAMC